MLSSSCMTSNLPTATHSAPLLSVLQSTGDRAVGLRNTRVYVPHIVTMHATSRETAHTFSELSAGLQCTVNGHSRVEHSSSLPEPPLPGHMVGQLAQAVGHTAQVYPAIPLPSPPCNCPVITPGPQGIRMCLQCIEQKVSSNTFTFAFTSCHYSLKLVYLFAHPFLHSKHLTSLTP